MIPKQTIEEIKSIAKLEEVASGFMKIEKAGSTLYAKCPVCGKSGKGKGMTFSEKKQVFKCFSCDKSGHGSIKFLMEIQKMTFTDALEFLADKYHIEINSDFNKKMKESQKAQRKIGKGKKTFTDIQLSDSGLTAKDVMATVFKDNDTDKTHEITPFTVGSLNDYYQLMPGYGNDMVIWYYDLEGKAIMFKREKRKTYEEFFRVRFQNPEEHKDRFGKPIKYYSPAGSGTQLYIPQKIRRIYQIGRQIETLYIQEGEKKAEKACKHDILSVGVMGIQNIGSHNTMPKDLQLLIQKCNVKKVVFMLDSDWQNISSDIKNGGNPQQRPLNFYYAIKNYKEYMLSFRNMGINLEVYFGAIKKNEKDEKGIDDLLAGSLKNKESDFLQDLKETMSLKSGQGSFCELHKITALTDYQIKDFWKLNSAQEFAEHHKDILINVPEFTINRNKYRFNENEDFELAEPVLPEEKYWMIDSKGKPNFNYKRAYTFLRNRGFGRVRMAGDWKYVHFKNHVVKTVKREEIKFFVTTITEEIASEDVQNLLFSGGHFYLGDHSLENMKFFDINFEKSKKDSQNMHFRNKFLRISSDKVSEHQLNEKSQTIWEDKIIDFDIKFLKEKMISFEQVDQDTIDAIEDPDIKKYYNEQTALPYAMILTDTGQKSHFLQFLINTSNFHWRESKNVAELKPDQYIDLSMHLLSKLTAMGYLCHRYYNPAITKAIIGMDGKLSEVGASNGRSGKSLFGEAIGEIIPQVKIPGKSKKLTDDNFLFGEITEKTENVFFDDVRVGMDFEFFFPNITGTWKINVKGQQGWTMDPEFSPKIYFATNHSFNGEGSSYEDRQHNIVFSDFYNEYHKPLDDFGMLFFKEWPEEQYNYYYNLVALSLQLYFKYGLVIAPQRDVRLRKLRQMMGESFLTWAEEYFAPKRETGVEAGEFGKSNLDTKIPRKDMYNDFDSSLKRRESDFYSATRFGKCVRYYCEYKGLHFNPHKPNKDGVNIIDFLNNGGKTFIGMEDKSSSVEYFTIGTDELTI